MTAVRLLAVAAILAALFWATFLIGATATALLLLLAIVIAGFCWAFVRIVFGYRDDT